ncbi:MAG TPA: hypothetical protein VF180_06850 [Acidimicrobiia bacterium]
MSDIEVEFLVNEPALANRTADLVAARLTEAVDARGRATLR